MKYLSKTRMGRWGENAVYRQELKKLVYILEQRKIYLSKQSMIGE